MQESLDTGSSAGRIRATVRSAGIVVAGSLAGTLMPEVRELLQLALDAAGASFRCGGDDDRTPAQRRHDAMGEIAQFFLAHAPLAEDTGERPRIVVTVPYEMLTGALSEWEAKWARLDSGVRIAPDTARRLACDAEILPVVLGGRGEILDVGRARRDFPTAIRRAARLRDGNRCGYPGCRRKTVELHHILWWSRGGRTSLDNAVWLCAFHHWLVHEGGWTLVRDEDGGYTFTSPQGRIRRNPPPEGPPRNGGPPTGPPRHPVAA